MISLNCNLPNNELLDRLDAGLAVFPLMDRELAKQLLGDASQTSETVS